MEESVVERAEAEEKRGVVGEEEERKVIGEESLRRLVYRCISYRIRSEKDVFRII